MRTRSKAAPSPFTGLYSKAPFGRELLGETMVDDGIRTVPLTDKPVSHVRREIVLSTGAFYEGGVPFFDSECRLYGAGYYFPGSAYCAVGNVPSSPSTIPSTVKVHADYASELAQAGRSDLHVISFVREISETIGMLKNPFKLVTSVSSMLGKHGMKKSFRRVPFGDLVKAGPSTLQLCASKKLGPKSATFRNAVDAGAGAWLEGTYGWSPFLSDIGAAAAALGEGLRARKDLKAVGRRSFRYSSSCSIEKSWSADSNAAPVYVKKGQRFDRYASSLWGQWDVNPSIQAESTVAALVRALNIDRLGYAVWDAVPYSFVFDWFLPLGNIIDDLASGPTFYITAGLPWLGERIRTDFMVNLSGSTTYSWRTSYSGTGFLYDRRIAYNRRAVDIGSLDLSVNGMHGTRIASGFPLAWGAISRRLR